MSAKIFDSIIEEQGVPRNMLRAMFMPADEPTIEAITDEVERTIKHAINLASEDKPDRAMIMTADRMRAIYEKNNHFKTTTLVRLASGKECLEILNWFYRSVERA